MDQIEIDYKSPYRDGLPGHRDRDTEIESAQDVKGRASENMKRIMFYLKSVCPEGATDYELQDKLNMFSAPKRRCDLMHQGLVVDSGLRRKTPRGKPAIVWKFNG